MTSESNLDELRLVELSKNMHQHSRLVGLALSAILIVTTLMGGVYLYEYQSVEDSEVLGLNQEGDLSTDEVSEEQLLELCESRKGIVIKKVSEEVGEQLWCVLPNGNKCQLNRSFFYGECSQDLGVVLGVVDESIEPTVVPTISPTPLADELVTAYSLQITQKPDGVEPVEPRLRDYLHVAMDLTPGNRDIIGIFYDTDFGNPLEEETRYYFDYIVVIRGEAIETPAEYSDYATVIRLSEVNQDTVPFVSNSNYCETNNDCVIRRSRCVYGAFNRYEAYVDGYSCMQIRDEFNNSLIHFDEVQNCKAERVFATPVCENNSCVPTQQASRCVE